MSENIIDNPRVLFDGVCNFCNKSIMFVINRDPHGHFKFASMQSAVGQKLLQKFGFPTDSFDTIVLIEVEGYSTKSTAALKIAKKLNRPWPMFSLFLIVPKFIRDAVYDLIANNRYKLFGKREACALPPVDVSDRFID